MQVATDIYDYVPVLRRMVSGPGVGPYVDKTDEELASSLLDGFWSARLDGFLADKTVNNTFVSPELSPEEAQIVSTYAAIRMIRSAIVWTETRLRAVAGPATYEVERSATLLKAVLEDLNGERERMLQTIESGALPSGDVYAADALTVRQSSSASYAGGGLGDY
jgi:hypothetical protein